MKLFQLYQFTFTDKPNEFAMKVQSLNFIYILYEPYNFSLLIKTKINKMMKKLFWLNLNFYEELPKCTLQFLFVKKNKFLYLNQVTT